MVIIPKEKEITEITPTISFKDLTEQIKELATQISNLRERILRTNLTTKVIIGGEPISLALLKLKIDDIRSEIAQIENLMDSSYSPLGFTRQRRQLLTKDVEEKEVPQLNDLELEKIYKDLELQKNQLEGLLEKQNALTALIE